MGLFKLLFPILDTMFGLGGADPVEEISQRNQDLADKLDEGTISVVLKATPEQIAEVQKLSNKRVPGKPYSPRGKYLIEHFGKEIAEEIRKHEKDGNKKT